MMLGSAISAAELRKNHVATTLALGLLVGLLSWPVEIVRAGIGLDASWVAALHLAAARGLHFGADIVYTFGPLGFLGLPQPYFGGSSALALVAVVGLHLTVCVALLHALRRTFPMWLAVLALYVVARSMSWDAGWDMVGIAGFIIAVEIVRRSSTGMVPTAAFAALGAVAGVALLGKLNVGITAAAIGLLTATIVGSPRSRAIAAFGAALAAGLILPWLLLGQRLADLPAYAQYSLEIVGGYSTAMGMDFGPTSEWVLVVAGLALMILAVAGHEATTGWSTRARVALAIIGLVMSFALFKTGFVRDRFGPFFAATLVLLPIFADRGRRALFGIALAGLLAIFLSVTKVAPVDYFNPVATLEVARLQIAEVGFNRRQSAAATQSQLQNLYGLTEEALTAIGGGSAHVQPWDAAVAFAYPQLRWDPLPVFQPYQAYTDALDALDAEALRSSLGPDRILWLTPPGEPLSIDGRSPYFDTPATMVEMLCRYVPVASAPSWQVLTRVANRCGPPQSLGSETVTVGQSIRVPPETRPNRIEIVRIHGVATAPIERVIGLLYKVPPWSMAMDHQTYRLVPGTADGPLVIGATGSLGYGDALALGAPGQMLTVWTGATGTASSDRLSVEFFSIAVYPETP